MKFFTLPLIITIVALTATESHAARFNDRAQPLHASGVAQAAAGGKVRQARPTQNKLKDRERGNDRFDRLDDRRNDQFHNRKDRRDDRYDNRRDDRWERYVKFRIGVRLLSLPARYSRVMIGTSVYFYSDGVYMVEKNGGYVVVIAPIGARVALLPYGFRSIYLGSRRYFHVNSTYYAYAPATLDYVVVKAPNNAPQNIGSTDPVVYPANGQSEAQVDEDRYECHKWAMNESGFDPSTQQADSLNQVDRYNRSIKACLSSRGYTVN